MQEQQCCKKCANGGKNIHTLSVFIRYRPTGLEDTLKVHEENRVSKENVR
jgi:hypothetical protein